MNPRKGTTGSGSSRSSERIFKSAVAALSVDRAKSFASASSFNQIACVALVRILVDGYSLLHSWPELAPKAARHSHQAREALITALQRYRDAVHTPITIVFDGQGAPSGTPKLPSTPELEILFSVQGKTADDMIERAAYRLRDYGEVLVVTDDLAERDTVRSFGVNTASCTSFINEIQSVVSDQVGDIKRLNRAERERWRRHHR